MIIGTTSSGFNYEIDENIKQDWRFIQLLSSLNELEESDSQEVDFINVMSSIEKLIFADKGKAFEKHIASKNEGKIPTVAVLTDLIEIIKNNETKN